LERTARAYRYARAVDDALARISAKLADLQAQGWEKHAHHYNVPGHRLALGPVITPDEVTAFEAKHGALPADYRAFITTIAGSGAGPYHGLRSLDCWDAGTVVLCDQGCGYWAGLRLDGDDRGRVVNVYEDHVTLSPLPSFLAWYEGWLDALLEGVATGSYGFFRGGSEDDLVRALATATTTEAQLDIITSLHHRATLASTTLDHVAPFIASPDPKLRTVSCGVLAREPRWIDTVAPLLDDPDIGVRHAVVFALERLDARSRAPDLARHIQTRYDERTSYSATSTLLKWGLLRGSMLVPAMYSTSSGVRGSIPGFLENLDDDLTPFEPLLADPDLHVRIYTVRAFAKRGALAALRARLPDETNETLRAAIAKHLNV